jgi:hypothetical protein
LQEIPTVEALRVWTGRFIDYATAKLGMADALRTVIDAGGSPYAQARQLMLDSMTALLTAGVDAGTIRSDITGSDVLAILTGIAVASGRHEQRERAERLLDLAIDGLSLNSSGLPQVPAGAAIRS